MILLGFDLADCKDILRDCNYFVWIPRWSLSKILVHYDGVGKASSHCILRDRSKHLKNTLVVVLHATECVCGNVKGKVAETPLW